MAAVGGGGEFVEGWLVAQLLGEGAYGEVRLLVHARSGACVALKVVRGSGGAAAGAREAALHRALRHPRVVRCLGARAQAAPPAHYLFVEYCAGGELFDRIEPDRGMPEPRARRYFAQLLDALGYLHARGLAHRDIKPENLLLDDRDDLKVSDFGMATLFRHGARERLLTRVCGTVPYAAPEVLAAAERPYRAPPADLWAAGVVLVAMLAGELPWERAHPSDARYAAWESAVSPAPCPAPAGPWRKMRGAARALLRRALHPSPATRATLPQLLQHRWLAPGEEEAAEGRAWRSQPADGGGAGGAAGAVAALGTRSQPTRADDLLADDLLAATQDTHTGVGVWARAGGVRLTRVRVAGAGGGAGGGAGRRRRRAAPRRLRRRATPSHAGGGVRRRGGAHEGVGGARRGRGGRGGGPARIPPRAWLRPALQAPLPRRVSRARPRHPRDPRHPRRPRPRVAANGRLVTYPSL